MNDESDATHRYPHCGSLISRDEYWLIQSQRLIHNVRAMINRGLTERADRAIEEYWSKWSDDCAGKLELLDE